MSGGDIKLCRRINDLQSDFNEVPHRARGICRTPAISTPRRDNNLDPFHHHPLASPCKVVM